MPAVVALIAGSDQQIATFKRDLPWAVGYASNAAGTINDLQPIIVSWRVDFNAGDPQGRFMAPPEEPGSARRRAEAKPEHAATTEGRSYPGSRLLPIRCSSARRAALRPSGVAQTISEAPRLASPTIKAFGCPDMYVQMLYFFNASRLVRLGQQQRRSRLSTRGCARRSRRSVARPGGSPRRCAQRVGRETLCFYRSHRRRACPVHRLR